MVGGPREPLLQRGLLGVLWAKHWVAAQTANAAMANIMARRWK